jgi:tetratricopeptide (TPR) repeat protein
VVAWIAAVTGWDWARAEAEFRRAIALDPGSGWGYFGLSDLLADLGRFDEGLAAAKAALERDPLAPFNIWEVGYLEMLAGRHEAAVKDFDQMIAMAPALTAGLPSAAGAYWWAGKKADALRLARDAATRDPSPTNRACLAYMLALNGRRAEAEPLLAGAIEEGERSYVSPAYVALARLALGDRDGALRWLERGVDERDYGMVALKTLPDYGPLRGDPRFQTLLRRMKFPD